MMLFPSRQTPAGVLFRSALTKDNDRFECKYDTWQMLEPDFCCGSSKERRLTGRDEWRFHVLFWHFFVFLFHGLFVEITRLCPRSRRNRLFCAQNPARRKKPDAAEGETRPTPAVEEHPKNA